MEDLGIKLVRLTSGEELVAEVTKDDNTYNLKNPTSVVVGRNDAGTATVYLLPYMPYVEQTQLKNGLNFDKSHVMLVAEPVSGMKDNFNQLWNKSSLIVPKKPVLIT